MVEASKEQQPDVEAEIVDGQVIAEAGQSSVDAGTIATAQEPEPIGENAMSIKKIQGIKVHVQAVLGGISLSVSELANLKQGEFIPLDTKIGDAIDILANGHLIARGEIVVLEEDTPRFGITLTEIMEPGSTAA